MHLVGYASRAMTAESGEFMDQRASGDPEEVAQTPVNKDLVEEMIRDATEAQQEYVSLGPFAVCRSDGFPTRMPGGVTDEEARVEFLPTVKAMLTTPITW